MKRFSPAGAVLVFALGAVSLSAADAPLQEIEGSYTVAAMTKNGKPVPDEVRTGVTVKFKGDDMTVVVAERTMTAKVKLDPSKAPRQIDILPADGPDKGKTFPGIYKVEAGELVIAFSEAGDRPTAFTGDGEAALMRLKKADGK